MVCPECWDARTNMIIVTSRLIGLAVLNSQFQFMPLGFDIILGLSINEICEYIDIPVSCPH